MRSIIQNRNFWIILTTLVVIALGYIFYLNFYTKNNQDQIIETRFRALDRISLNVKSKVDVYRKNAANFMELVEREFRKELKKYDVRSAQQTAYQQIQTDKDPSDPLYKRLGFYTKWQISTFNANKILEDIIEARKPAQSNKNIEFVDIKWNEDLFESQIDSLRKRSDQFISNPDYKYFSDIPFSIDTINRAGYVTFRASNEAIFKEILKSNLFEGFIVIENNKLTYSSMKNEITFHELKEGEQLLKEVLGKGSASDHVEPLYLLNDSTTRAGILSSGQLINLELAQKPYKLFIKPIRIENNTWYVGGLMTTEQFNILKHRVAPRFILLLSLILILIMLSLPIVKLWVLSDTEQLSTGTIINSAISVMLGGSFFILFILFIAQNQSRESNNDNNLEVLNRNIRNAVFQEFDSIRKQLSSYDSNFEEIANASYRENCDSIMVWDVLNLDEGDPAYPRTYPFYDYTFWIGKDGHQKYQLTPRGKSDNLISVAGRDYFKKYNQWIYPGTESERFRIESIVSLTSGVAKGAFSMPAHGKYPVLAMTSRFYSLINPIMPKDYAFCLIDNQGKIWFHSDHNKNLRENLLNECSGDEHLAAALYGHIEKHMTVNYKDEPYRVFISPLANLPLFIVTLYKKEAEQSFQAQVFTFTLALTAALFIFIFLQSLGLILLERVHIRKVHRNLLFEMTRPRKKLNEKYFQLTWLYVVLIVLFSVFMVFIKGYSAIVGIFTFIIIVYVYSYRYLNEQESRKQNRIWFTFGNLVLLLIINFAALKVLPPSEHTLNGILQLATIGIILGFDRLSRLKIFNPSENYQKNYWIFLVILLVLFGIMPILKFYEVAYDQETLIRTRHHLMDLMNKREQRNMTLNEEINSADPGDLVRGTTGDRKELGIYTLFLDSTYFTKADSALNEIDTICQNSWDDLFTTIRPIYDEYIDENKFLLSDLPEENHFRWGQQAGRSYLFYESTTEKSNASEITRSVVTSRFTFLSYLAPFMGKSYNGWEKLFFNLLFWLFIISIIYLIYHVVRFGTKRIFGLYLVEMYSHHHFKYVIQQRLETDRSIFIARQSPFDESDDIKQEFINKEKTNYFDWSNPDEIDIAVEVHDIIDTNRSPEKSGRKEAAAKVIMIIDQFDWNYANHRLFLKKLQELDYLIEKRDAKLIIISQVDPDIILDHYNPASGKVENQINKDSATGTEQEEIYFFLKQIMEKMIIRYAPVSFHYSWEDEEAFCSERDVVLTDREFIEKELGCSDYLTHYMPALEEFLESQNPMLSEAEARERIMTRINALAAKYYQGLINSCTDEEKYVLYDLATDMIMNPRNSTAIFRLLEKGILIKRCDSINFMNESFRKYLIDTVSKASIKEMEKRMGKETGSWQGYRTTLLLIIAGLFIFITLGNREFLDNLNQLFIVLGAGMAFITGVIGIISRKGKVSGER